MDAHPLKKAAAALLAAALLFAAACSKTPKEPSAENKPPANTFIFAGTCYSFHEPEPRRYEAVFIEGNHILAAGTEREIMAMRRVGTRLVRLEPGQALIPGLIDAHGHLFNLGLMRHVLDLRECRGYGEVLEKVRERAAAAPKGEWILGRGWDQNLWPGKKFPAHGELSKITPEHPVWLIRVDGHAGLANAKAMETAGITASAEAPEGGRLERGADGGLTGIFVDRAMDLIGKSIPAMPPERSAELLLQAAHECADFGLTAVHDAGASVQVIKIIEELARQKKIPLRVYAMVDARREMPAQLSAIPPLLSFADGMFAVRCVKFSLDGALGSRGAALLEAYSDAPKEKGLLLLDENIFEERVRACYTRGYQVAVHCIGDRANRTALEVFERVLAEEKNPAALRWRMEHAQVVHPEDIPRFAKLGLVASMQPVHCTSDMSWAKDRLGPKRLEGAYAWQSFLKAGCVLACGTDFPVESVNPFQNIYAAITRQDARGNPPGGWQPAQRLSRHEVLRAYTWGAAYAAFAEKEQGLLAPGAYADITVLDRDPMEVAPEKIRETRVLFTMVGGVISHQEPEFLIPLQ